MNKNSKTILVTGAASGIGLAITNFLVEKGDHVIATDFNEKALDLLSNIDSISTFYLDVTNPQSINDAFEKICEKFTTIDGLVNNAGIFVGGPLVEIRTEDLERIFAVNVIGVFNITKAFFPLLYPVKGRIVNIGSESGRFSYPLNGPYSMSKYALEAFSDSLRRELMFLDISVVHLQIGAVKTPLLHQTYTCFAEDNDVENSLFKKQLEQVIKVCEKEIDKGAEPETIAKVVYKALHKRKPKSRYKVKNDKLRRFLEFLPTSVVDTAMKKALK